MKILAACTAILFTITASVALAEAPETAPLPTPRPSLAAPETAPLPMPRLSDEEKAVLQLLFFEARNQSLWGQILVFEVGANRVADPRFPGTFRAVVEDRRHACQFAYECDGKPERPPLGERQVWKMMAYRAIALHREWKSGRYEPQTSCPVLFFHVTGIKLSKPQRKDFASRTYIGQVGDHTFYCDKDELTS